MNKKTYLKRIVSSYAFLILVQVLAIIWINIHVNGIIKNQVQRQNEAYLNQFLSSIERTLTELENIQRSVLSSDYHHEYISSVNLSKAYRSYKLLNNLKKVLSLNYVENFMIEDMFIYFKNEDRIISGVNGALDSSMYINVHTCDTPVAKDNFVTSGTEQHLFTVTKDGKTSLAVSMPYINQIMGSKNASSAVVVLEPDSITNLNDLLKIYNNSEVAIFNEKKELIISSGDMINLEKYTGDPVYRDTFGGEEYSLNVHKNPKSQYYFVTAVPTSIYLDQVFSINIVSIIWCVLFTVLSFLIALKLSYITYNPVKNIVNKIQGSTDANVKVEKAENKVEINELDFILDSFQNINNEKDMLINKVDSQETERKRAYLIRLINGTVESQDDNFSKYNMEVVSAQFIVVLFSVEKYNKETLAIKNEEEVFKLLSLIYQNILEELSLKYGCGYFWSTRMDRFILLLNIKDEFKDNIKEHMKNLCDEFTGILKKHFESTNTISIGSLESGTDNICKSYQNAKYAMNSKFLCGRESIIFFDNLSDDSSSHPIEIAKYKNLMFSCISDADCKPVKETVDTIIRHMDGQSFSNILINKFKYGVINSIEDLANNIGNVKNIYSLIYLLSATETMQDFRDLLIQILEAFQSYYINTQQEDCLSNKIAKYIKENYNDLNISSVSISEKFGLSKAYISRVFKLDYDKTVSEYITEIRIHEAKILLETTNLSIKEIAQKTGFLSANTFIRIFKKMEFITPGAYAEKQQNRKWNT